MLKRNFVNIIEKIKLAFTFATLRRFSKRKSLNENSIFFPLSKLATFFCIYTIGFTACHDEAALKQALIEQTVQEKINNHQRKKIATCGKDAMKEALILADSLIIRAALSKSDTSGRLRKPLKPNRPAIELPTDTTPIKPLFEDSLLQKKDTSLRIQEKDAIPADSIPN